MSVGLCWSTQLHIKGNPILLNFLLFFAIIEKAMFTTGKPISSCMPFLTFVFMHSFDRRLVLRNSHVTLLCISEFVWKKIQKSLCKTLRRVTYIFKALGRMNYKAFLSWSVLVLLKQPSLGSLPEEIYYSDILPP